MGSIPTWSLRVPVAQVVRALPCFCGGTADALGLGPSTRKGVQVQLLSRAFVKETRVRFLPRRASASLVVKQGK